MVVVKKLLARSVALVGAAGLLFLVGVICNGTVSAVSSRGAATPDPAQARADRLVAQGRNIFRFDTFGDEAVWGGVLGLHKTIEGEKLGGVGPGLGPKQALALGLKVDSAALPAKVVAAIKAGKVDLNDPAVTLTLLKLNAVVGVKGFFDSSGNLASVGITCAVCHSTVDDSFAPGIGKRLDGWPNQDLNVGAIVAGAPNLTPLEQSLHVDEATLKRVLLGWGPGKFNAELDLDGKALGPDGTPGSAATRIPSAFGKDGQNLHTWEGGWGSVSFWNAFVANLEMHGIGNFFDRGSTTRPSSRWRRQAVSVTPIRTSERACCPSRPRRRPPATRSPRPCARSTSISARCRCRDRQREASTRRQRRVGRRSSTASGRARAATWARSGPPPATTASSPPRSASTRSRRIAVPTART
jgi:hypothetical protein